MKSLIKLDGESLDINEDCLPCIISYQERMGGSHFSISYATNLALSGSKLIFTAFPWAKDNLLQQISDTSLKTKYIEKEFDIKDPIDVDIIIVKSGDEKVFYSVISKIKNLTHWVIFIKNIEEYSPNLLKNCLNFKNIIFSGNIDKCSIKDYLINKKFKTLIYFNQPNVDIGIKIPKLEKYTAYLSSFNKKGIVRVKRNNK